MGGWEDEENSKRCILAEKMCSIHSEDLLTTPAHIIYMDCKPEDIDTCKLAHRPHAERSAHKHTADTHSQAGW